MGVKGEHSTLRALRLLRQGLPASAWDMAAQKPEALLFLAEPLQVSFATLENILH